MLPTPNLGLSYQDRLTRPEVLYACLFVLLAVTSLCIATLLLPAPFTPVSRVISWVLSIYLQLQNPIQHTETGRSIPGPNYVWPNGQGDVEKVLTRPEQLHAIFRDSDKHTKATNSDSGYFMSRILGQCLGLMAGQRWKFLKGIAAPPFMHPAAVRSIGRIQEHVRAHFHDLESIGNLREGRIHPVQDLKMLPFFIVAEANYGSLTPDMKSELNALAPARENLMKFVLFGGLARFNISRFFPTEANRQLQRFRSQWRAFNRAAYERARDKHPSAMVVQMYDAVLKGTLSEEQVAQTMDETLYANLDVTTGGLSWNLVFLAANPACQARLHEEISALTTAEEEGYISRNGTYLAACVLESSRLRPALPFTIPQSAPTERVVDGYRIPAGTNYVVDTWGLNVRNEFWAPDNDTYRPERFLNSSNTDLRYHFWRFGFGPRQCIGRYTADVVIRAILLHLVKHYELQMLEEGSWTQDPECWITHPDLQVSASQPPDNPNVRVTSAALLPEPPQSPSRQQELLVPDGASTRYINEAFLSQILDKEKALYKVIGTPRDTDEINAGLRPEGILASARRPAHGGNELDLSRWQSAQLWQIYRNNVDPVVKILHLPTVEPLVYSIMNGEGSDDCRALLFAIYFAAVTSLAEVDAANLLGRDRRSSLRDFQARFEKVMIDAACLDAPSMLSLQALAIYITCLRAHRTSRSGWIINGVLIRAALSIGLHRDGTHFNLPPFDAEVRRRLWWQILVLDYRAAEDHGLAVHGFGSRSDTRLPLHVNDSDLSPDLRILPGPRAKWTEMSLFLLTSEIAIAFQKVYQSTLGQRDLSQRLQTVHELTTYLESTYLCNCDTNIPIQKVAWLSTRSLLSKFEFSVYQVGLSNDQSQEAVSSTAEQTLISACACLEQSMELQTDDLLRGFRWLFASYNQFHCLMYLLWHLCAQPAGPHVVRVWNIVDAVFNITENDPTRPDPGPTWKVLRHLREKAIQRRANVAMSSPTQPRGASEERVLESRTAEEHSGQDAGGAADGFGDLLAPLDPSSLTDWINLSENLGMYRFEP
ncbi:cytochrome P450 [Aspergillus pseudonomiae]|uniref:Cytochrome P450 n=1 Tax=Aspergillus pseudonomiae TaxID=1506151 RepID=A0A5N7D3K7_9EURO|nr:cytochrome P450 [Aspergillus pseudonomiae]KAB8264793.1 cytochrome P450 [Aspergillus pseudonomiae]KAE8400986.1 cytochrome P450 [Aspergillus pseudonomiae]